MYPDVKVVVYVSECKLNIELYQIIDQRYRIWKFLLWLLNLDFFSIAQNQLSALSSGF